MLFEREEILYDGHTGVEHYQVVDMVYEGRAARVLFSGTDKAAFSGIPRDGNNEMLFCYNQRFYEIAATLRPQRVLVIGGGVYTLPMVLLQALPDVQIDAVEIDPGLEALAEAFFGLEANPRLTIYHTDGAAFLKSAKGKYDMIIMDAFNGFVIPDSLAGEDAIKLCSARLAKNGVMALNFISSYYGRQSDTMRRTCARYIRHFAKVDVYPAERGISLWIPQNFVLVAQKSPEEIHHGIAFSPLKVAL